MNSQDANPPTSALSQQTGTISSGSNMVTGLASTYQLSVGQLVTQFVSGSATSGILNGTTITAIGSNGTSIQISKPATASGSVKLTFGSSQPEGNDTLIAGSGNSELFAGSGEDLLIGGTAVLQKGQFELPSNGSAGRDVLVGGSGNDLLIAAPNSPGAVMIGGSGTDTLIGGNAGIDDMEGGTGATLFLGGQGTNVIQGYFGADKLGNDTLVAGLGGTSTLVAGTGNDALYASYSQSEWQLAISAAAQDFNVVVVPPAQSGSNVQLISPQLQQNLENYFASDQDEQNVGDQVTNFAVLAAAQGLPGLGTPGSLQTLIDEYLSSLSPGTQVGALIYNLLNEQLTPGGQGLPQQNPDELDTLAFLLAQDPRDDSQLIANLLSLDQPSQTFTTNEEALLVTLLVNEGYQLLAQGNTYENEYLAMQDDLAKVPQQTPAQEAQLASLGALANDTFTNLIKINSDFLGTENELVGGSGDDTFYNATGNDTIIGGAGPEQTLMIQADGTVNLTASDPSNPDEPPDGKGIWVQINGGAAFELGNGVNNISNINRVGVETGDQDGDTVNVDVPELPSSLTGLYVRLGDGDGDVIDAQNAVDVVDPGVSATATLLGGAGDDTISINANIATGSVYQGSAASELDIYGSDNRGPITVANGGLNVDEVPINSQTGVLETSTTTTGTITTISNLVTANLYVGQSVSGAGIPAGTTISTIAVNGTSITISQNASTSGREPLTFGIGFKKVVVIGGSGTSTGPVTNTFTSDGTIPNVILEGGAGAYTTNNLTAGGIAGGNTAELTGGSGAVNNFTLNGPGSYSVIGSNGTNVLEYNSNDTANGQGLTLSENDYLSTSDDANSAIITISGVVNNSPVFVQAANMDTSTTSIFVNSGSGKDDLIEASNMTMSVTLDKNGGGGINDNLIGGAGDNTLYYSGSDGIYNGGSGTDNQLVYPDSSGDSITVFNRSFYDSTTGVYYPLGAVTNVETYVVSGSPASVARGDDTFAPGSWTTVENPLGQTATDTVSNQTVQELSGGNPGAYLFGADTSTPINAANIISSGFIEGHLFNDYSYNPAQGAINGLVVSFDVNILYCADYYYNGAVNPPSFGVLLEQGGQYFTTSNFYNYGGETTTPGWVHFSLENEITAGDFDPYSPNFTTSGAPIEFGFYVEGYNPSTHQFSRTTGLPAATNFFEWGVDNFSVRVDNGMTQAAFPVGPPLTITSLTASAGSQPADTLTVSFTDPNPNASAELSVLFSWGDGTSTSQGSLSANGQDFTATARHVFANRDVYTITATVIDSQGAAASASGMFDLGLALDYGSYLDDFLGDTATGIDSGDSGVNSYVVRNTDSTVFSLHNNGDLLALTATAGSSIQEVDTGIQTTPLGIAVGPDGTLFALHPNGNLDTAPTGSDSPTFTVGNVQTIVQASDGSVYRLDTDEDLYRWQDTSSGWNWGAQPIAQGVSSMSKDPDSPGIDAMFTDGVYYYFGAYQNTFGFSLLALPTLLITAPSSATAGQAIPVTLSVENAFQQLATDFTGTVQFTSSDLIAGLPQPYSFVASDQGSHTFDATLTTAGIQTLTASLTGGAISLGSGEFTGAFSGVPANAYTGSCRSMSRQPQPRPSL